LPGRLLHREEGLWRRRGGSSRRRRVFHLQDRPSSSGSRLLLFDWPGRGPASECCERSRRRFRKPYRPGVDWRQIYLAEGSLDRCQERRRRHRQEEPWGTSRAHLLLAACISDVATVRRATQSSGCPQGGAAPGNGPLLLGLVLHRRATFQQGRRSSGKP